MGDDLTLSQPGSPREDRTLSHPGEPVEKSDEQTLSRPAGADDAGGRSEGLTLSKPGALGGRPEGLTLSQPARGARASGAPPPPAATAASEKAIWEIGNLVDGKYEVTGVIGKGGMGIVYKVHHREWNIDLAVKTPLPHLVHDKPARARFFREAQTWVDLGLHPNIVQCWYVRELGGLPRVFADFIAGGSLKNWTQEMKVRAGDWPAIIDLVIQACDGLDYAHERGVVHRDVKPANMLMTPDGRLLVTDFGLVKVTGMDEIESESTVIADADAPASIEAGLTMTGSLMGTPEYGAPEQWGEARHVDARADIYALGIMLYEMCCGRRPFDDGSHKESTQAIIGRHLASAPPDPRTFRPDIPEDLVAAALQCLAKKPEQRPASMRLLRGTLAKIHSEISGEPYAREIPKASAARAAALNNRAVSLWDLEQPAEAFSAWQEALKLDARHPEALYNKSLLEWRASRITDLDAVERVNATQAAPARVHLYLGMLHAERLAADEAEPEFLQALGDEVIAKDGIVWRALGHAQMAQKKFDAAQASYAQAARLMPGDRLSRELEALAQSVALLSPQDEKVLAALEQFHFRGCIKTIDKNAGSMRCLAVTPDGKHLLGARGDYSLCMWDLPWGNYIRSYVDDEDINAVGTSPDGTYILTGGAGSVLRAWDTNTEFEKDGFFGRGHVHVINALSISNDGSLLASGGSDKAVRLWSLPLGSSLTPLWGHTEAIQAICVTPDARAIVSASDDQSVRVWDLVSGTEHVVLPLPDGIGAAGAQWKALALTPDGTAVFAGGTDGILCQWDLASFCFVKSFPGHRGAVLALALTPDANYLLSSGEDHTVRLWHVASGRCLRTYTGHSGAVKALAVMLDGRAVCSGALENKNHPLRVWALEPGLPGLTEHVLAPLAVCKVESHAASQATSKLFEKLMHDASSAQEKRDPGTAYITLKQARAVPGYERDPAAMALNTLLSKVLPRVGLAAGYHRCNFDGHADGIKSLALAPDGRYAVSAGNDEKELQLWDMATGRAAARVEAHKRAIEAVAMTRDGRHFVAASADDTLSLWELSETPKCIRRFGGHKDAVLAAAVSPDGRRILSGSYDCTLALWDLSTGRCVRTFLGHSEPVKTVAVTPDGLMAVSGSRDGTVRLWSFATGACSKTFEGHDAEVRVVRVAPNGRTIVSGGEDKTIRIWNIATGNCEAVLKGSLGAVTSLAFTPDGRFVFSGGLEGPQTPLRLWEINTGRCVHSFGLHAKGISALSLSSDACFLICGGNDSPLRVWDLEWELDSNKKVAAPAPEAPSARSPSRVINAFSFDAPIPKKKTIVLQANAADAAPPPAPPPVADQPIVPAPSPPPPPPPAHAVAPQIKRKKNPFGFE